MWTTGIWAALALSSAIGLSLGLVGGGGSIVTVPILIYVAGLMPREAICLIQKNRIFFSMPQVPLHYRYSKCRYLPFF